MPPREFTNSTAVHLGFEYLEQEQIKKYLFSMDPYKRDKLAEACAYISRVFTPKSRKELGLVKLCASLIEEGFPASSIVRPPARALRSSRVAATAISVALGVFCVVGLAIEVKSIAHRWRKSGQRWRQAPKKRLGGKVGGEAPLKPTPRKKVPEHALDRVPGEASLKPTRLKNVLSPALPDHLSDRVPRIKPEQGFGKKASSAKTKRKRSFWGRR